MQMRKDHLSLCNCTEISCKLLEPFKAKNSLLDYSRLYEPVLGKLLPKCDTIYENLLLSCHRP